MESLGNYIIPSSLNCDTGCEGVEWNRSAWGWQEAPLKGHHGRVLEPQDRKQ